MHYGLEINVTSALPLRHSTSKHASAASASAPHIEKGTLNIPDDMNVLLRLSALRYALLAALQTSDTILITATHGCVERTTALANDALMSSTRIFCINQLSPWI